jgi:hypothetical protein
MNLKTLPALLGISSALTLIPSIGNAAEHKSKALLPTISSGLVHTLNRDVFERFSPKNVQQIAGKSIFIKEGNSVAPVEVLQCVLGSEPINHTLPKIPNLLIGEIRSEPDVDGIPSTVSNRDRLNFSLQCNKRGGWVHTFQVFKDTNKIN